LNLRPPRPERGAPPDGATLRFCSPHAHRRPGGTGQNPIPATTKCTSENTFLTRVESPLAQFSVALFCSRLATVQIIQRFCPARRNDIVARCIRVDGSHQFRPATAVLHRLHLPDPSCTGLFGPNLIDPPIAPDRRRPQVCYGEPDLDQRIRPAGPQVEREAVRDHDRFKPCARAVGEHGQCPALFGADGLTAIPRRSGSPRRLLLPVRPGRRPR
jgi:hypothetical protein